MKHRHFCTVLSILTMTLFFPSTGMSYNNVSAPLNESTGLENPLIGKFVENRGQEQKDVRFTFLEENRLITFFDTHVEFSSSDSDDSIALEFVEADERSMLVGHEMSPSKLHYYRNGESFESVSSFDSIIYANIYPGIDLIFKNHHGKLKREFHVSPGANPQIIRFQFSNATYTSIQNDGSLKVAGHDTSLVESAPFTFQGYREQPKAIESSFKILAGGEIGFNIGKFDPKQKLIIDPEFAFSRELSASQDVSTIDVDWTDQGIFMVGVSNSPDFPATVEGQKVYNGDSDLDGFGDIVVTKVDPETGDLIFATFIGGSETDFGNGIRVNANGEIYISGWTKSPDYPVLNPIQDSLNGPSDGIITKLDPSGKIIFSTYLGGSGDDQFSSLDMYREGFISDQSIALTGFSNSSDFPFPEGNSGSADTSCGCADGATDVLVVYLKPDDSIRWATFVGGSQSDVALDIAIGTNGNAFLTGWTESAGFPRGLFQRHQGGKDGFIVEIDFFGRRRSAELISGSQDEQGEALTLLGFNGVVATGTTNSEDLRTNTPFQETYGGGDSDGFYARLDPNGSGSKLKESSYLGGSGADQIRAVAYNDTNQTIYFVGNTNSKDLELEDALDDSFNGGPSDFWINSKKVLVNSFNRRMTLESKFETLGGEDGEDGFLGVAIEPTPTEKESVILVGVSNSPPIEQQVQQHQDPVDLSIQFQEEVKEKVIFFLLNKESKKIRYTVKALQGFSNYDFESKKIIHVHRYEFNYTGDITDPETIFPDLKFNFSHNQRIQRIKLTQKIVLTDEKDFSNRMVCTEIGPELQQCVIDKNLIKEIGADNSLLLQVSTCVEDISTTKSGVTILPEDGSPPDPDMIAEYSKSIIDYELTLLNCLTRKSDTTGGNPRLETNLLLIGEIDPILLEILSSNTTPDLGEFLNGQLATFRFTHPGKTGSLSFTGIDGNEVTSGIQCTNISPRVTECQINPSLLVNPFGGLRVKITDVQDPQIPRDFQASISGDGQNPLEPNNFEAGSYSTISDVSIQIAGSRLITKRGLTGSLKQLLETVYQITNNGPENSNAFEFSLFRDTEGDGKKTLITNNPIITKGDITKFSCQANSKFTAHECNYSNLEPGETIEITTQDLIINFGKYTIIADLIKDKDLDKDNNSDEIKTSFTPEGQEQEPIENLFPDLEVKIESIVLEVDKSTTPPSRLAKSIIKIRNNGKVRSINPKLVLSRNGMMSGGSAKYNTIDLADTEINCESTDRGEECSLVDIGPGQTIEILFEDVVPAQVPGNKVSLEAIVSADTIDLNLANNEASKEALLMADVLIANMTTRPISLNDEGQIFIPGISTKLQVANLGLLDAENVVLTISQSGQLVTSPESASSSIPLPNGTCNPTDDGWSCNIGLLKSGECIDFEFVDNLTIGVNLGLSTTTLAEVTTSSEETSIENNTKSVEYQYLGTIDASIQIRSIGLERIPSLDGNPNNSSIVANVNLDVTNNSESITIDKSIVSLEPKENLGQTLFSIIDQTAMESPISDTVAILNDLTPGQTKRVTASVTLKFPQDTSRLNFEFQVDPIGYHDSNPSNNSAKRTFHYIAITNRQLVKNPNGGPQELILTLDTKPFQVICAELVDRLKGQVVGSVEIQGTGNPASLRIPTLKPQTFIRFKIKDKQI